MTKKKSKGAKMSRGYRPNAGLVIFNPEGLVFMGRRANVVEESAWQFPQGGIDADESVDAAALRELYEETGIRSVTLLERAPRWTSYDYPPGAQGAKVKQGYVGQTQLWFAFRFDGDESEIDLTIDKEFSEYRWSPLVEAALQVVDFKRAVYEDVIKMFSHLTPRENTHG